MPVIEDHFQNYATGTQFEFDNVPGWSVPMSSGGGITTAEVVSTPGQKHLHFGNPNIGNAVLNREYALLIEEFTMEFRVPPSNGRTIVSIGGYTPNTLLFYVGRNEINGMGSSEWNYNTSPVDISALPVDATMRITWKPTNARRASLSFEVFTLNGSVWQLVGGNTNPDDGSLPNDNIDNFYILQFASIDPPASTLLRVNSLLWTHGGLPPEPEPSDPIREELCAYLTDLLPPGRRPGSSQTAAASLVCALAGNLKQQVLDTLRLTLDSLSVEARPYALALIGASRAITRLPNETESAYRLRVTNALESWKFSGTPQGIINMLLELGYNAVVTERSDAWSDFRVSLTGGAAIPPIPKWGATNQRWGTSGLRWGVSSAEAQRVFEYLLAIKPAHTRLREIRYGPSGSDYPVYIRGGVT